MIGKSTVMAAALAAAGLAGAARAQDFKCDNGVGAAADTYIQSFAVARQAVGGGVEIAVNEERAGVGLGRQTKEWLFARQCILAANAGASPQVDNLGLVQFSPIEHREADCAAFQRIVQLYNGQTNALSVIDRDILGAQRGTYWDQSLGQQRTISSEACLGG